MTSKLPTCFACGTPLVNTSIPCPKCGYIFSASDNRVCPNNLYSVCKITENMCTKGINFMECPTKIKADLDDHSFDL